MSRSRRGIQHHLPFTAAFALIQVLREPLSRPDVDVNVNVDAAQNGLRIGMDTDTGSPSEPLFAQSDPEEMFLPQSHEPFCNDFMNALSKDPLSEDFLRKKRYEERD